MKKNSNRLVIENYSPLRKVHYKTMQNNLTKDIKQDVRYHTRITRDKFRRNKLQNGRLADIFCRFYFNSEILHDN